MTPGPSPSRTSFLEAAGQSEKRGENGTGLGGEKTLWPRNRRSGHKRRLVEASRPTRAWKQMLSGAASTADTWLSSCGTDFRSLTSEVQEQKSMLLKKKKKKKVQRKRIETTAT